MTWILAAGIALRALLIATTGGTSDLGMWDGFVRAVEQYGFTGAYGTPRLNHPPLGMLIVCALDRIGPLAITLRAFSAVSDLVTALLVARIAQRLNFDARLAAALFFLSPVSILTSSYYCNTDSFLTTLVVASVLLLLHDRPIAAGAVFACACGIKIVPVLVLPLLLMQGRTRFAAAFSVVTGAIFLPVFVRDPMHFIANVIAYAGSGHSWGLALPSTLAGATGKVLHLEWLRTLGYRLGDLYNATARVFIIAAVGWVTWTYWRNLKRDALPAAVTLGFLAAIAAAPRVTLGYFVWLIPMLLFAFSRRLAIAINIVASLQLIFQYTLYSHGFPWRFADLGTPTNPWWLGRAADVSGLPLWLLLVWALFAGTRALRS